MFDRAVQGEVRDDAGSLDLLRLTSAPMGIGGAATGTP